MQTLYVQVDQQSIIIKSTCLDVLYRMARLLLQTNQEYQIISWPNEARQNIISNHFNSDGFSGNITNYYCMKILKVVEGVIGCIDGSHIRIKAPRQNKNSYINRKGYHSVLLQAVCNHKKAFTNVYTGEAGSIHDYTLYRRSDLAVQIQNGNIIN
jgi:hypothetical protein